MCVCKHTYVHKLPVVHMRVHKCLIYGGKRYQECMNAHNQTTNTHNFDTHLGSCKWGDIEAVISLFISI